jgi:hypothetical protein
MNTETRIPPRENFLDECRINFTLCQEHLENFVGEEFLQGLCREDRQGMELTFLIETTLSDQCMQVRMEINQTAKGLDGHKDSWDKIFTNKESLKKTKAFFTGLFSDKKISYPLRKVTDKK